MRFAQCHPDRKYYGKNLCTQCYNKKLHEKRYKDPKRKYSARKRASQWRKDYPEESRRIDKNKHLKRKYGITLEQYEMIFKSQNGLCALCKQKETTTIENKRTNTLAVDHNHKTGLIRGLLCMRCNTSISQIEKNPIILSKLEAYLKGDK